MAVSSPAVPAPGAFLPLLSLPSAPAGSPVPLRTHGRAATILIRLGAERRDACLALLRAIEAARAELEVWDARVLAVVAGTVEDAERVRAEAGLRWVRVLADEAGRGPLVRASGPAWAVADRFGQLYHAEALESARPLPEVRELEEWLKFLATQCPE